VGTGDANFQSELAEEAGTMRGWLLRYFRRRVPNVAEAEDLVQDVFARMVARDSTEPVGHLGGYVLKTASNVLTDWIRRRSSRQAKHHVAFEPELHGEEDAGPERILGGTEELQAATRVLLQLPERTRTVLILRRLEGWKFQDIAAHLGISVSAVEKHLVRAIQELSLDLEKRNAS
jgi:RNA polymerase sigma factor (sigma-70 family)